MLARVGLWLVAYCSWVTGDENEVMCERRSSCSCRIQCAQVLLLSMDYHDWITIGEIELMGLIKIWPVQGQVILTMNEKQLQQSLQVAAK